MKVYSIYIFAFLLALSGCVTNPSIPAPPRVDSNQIVHLNDSPAVEFSTSGWSYTNTTNPFLLTPDYLTNAMLGVSRLRKGEALPNNGPLVPNEMNSDSIKSVLSERLKDKSNLRIETKVINNREVVVASYSQNNKQGFELAFQLKENLVHILLLANEGQYYNQGEKVAYNIAKTIKSK